MLISQHGINQIFYLKQQLNEFMITLNQLRVCKSCGNVFAKKAGVSIITSCPHCDGVSFDTIVTDET